MDDDFSSLKFIAVHVLDSFICSSLGVKGDEPEASGFSENGVHYDLVVDDVAELSELLFEVSILYPFREVGDVQSLA